MKRLQILIHDVAHGRPLPLDKAPWLARLLARGRARDSSGPVSASAALAAAFSTPGGHRPSLVHARLGLDGVDTHEPHWLCADPVHLHLGLQSLTLMAGTWLGIDPGEAGALSQDLNAHFGPGIRFLAPHPERWYVRFERPLQARILPLDEVDGQTLATHWVQGPDAQGVQALGNEIQMLLHEHPVNLEREARGLRPINGLWLWGGGEWSPPGPGPARVYAELPLALALGRCSGANTEALPDRLDPLRLPDGPALIVATLDQCLAHDRAWFEPAFTALRRGQLANVEISLANHPRGTLRISPLDAWRFWRTPKDWDT